jgi:hypothetical protein
MASEAHWSDAQAPAARQRGKAKPIAEPRAVAARYEAETDRIIVDLASGATPAFPPALVEFLQDATPETARRGRGAGRGLRAALGDAGRRLYRARPDERHVRHRTMDGSAGGAGEVEGEGGGLAREWEEGRQAEEGGVMRLMPLPQNCLAEPTKAPLQHMQMLLRAPWIGIFLRFIY